MIQNIIASILPAGAAMEKAREAMAQANVESSVTTLIQTRGIAGLIGLLLGNGGAPQAPRLTPSVLDLFFSGPGAALPTGQAAVL